MNGLVEVLLVAGGAVVGAPLRFLTDRFVVGRILAGGARPFPWGTLAVNVIGSFVLGLLTGVTNPAVGLLVGVGFCGAFTTYSTFSAETLQAARTGRRTTALLNVVLNLGLGLAAAIAGALLV